jgi:hypothetical protein
MGEGVSVTSPPLFTPGKDPLLILQEAGWTLGPVWTGTENLFPTAIRSPDPPAHSHSLYRLSYPATMFGQGAPKIYKLKFFNLLVTGYYLTLNVNKRLFLTKLLSSTTGYFEIYGQLLGLLRLYSVSTLVMETVNDSEASETSMRKYHTRQCQTTDNPPLEPQTSYNVQ